MHCLNRAFGCAYFGWGVDAGFEGPQLSKCSRIKDDTGENYIELPLVVKSPINIWALEFTAVLFGPFAPCRCTGDFASAEAPEDVAARGLDVEDIMLVVCCLAAQKLWHL